jgi:Arm DNA-binding domain
MAITFPGEDRRESAYALLYAVTVGSAIVSIVATAIRQPHGSAREPRKTRLTELRARPVVPSPAREGGNRGLALSVGDVSLISGRFAASLPLQCGQKLSQATFGRFPVVSPGGEPVKLTDKNVAGLELAGKTDVICFDDILTGFGHRMRIDARGRMLRSWIVQYRVGGRPRRFLLGAAGVIGAEPARAAARKILARVALGEDPAADRSDRRGRDRLTLRSVVDEYLAAVAARVRAKTLSELRRYLTGPTFRAFHGVAIDRLERRDIAARLVVLERERGAPTAAKARAAMSGLYVWGMRAGIVDANPARRHAEAVRQPRPRSYFGRR